MSQACTLGAEPSSGARRLYRGGLRAFLALCAGLTLLRVLGLHFVYSESVPVGAYWRTSLREGERPARGEFVCFEGWAASAPASFKEAVHAAGLPLEWLEDEPLVKQVAATGGDLVEYVGDASGGHVEVNGRALPSSTVLERAGNGALLPVPPYPLELGADEVWLTSLHPRGFDSRYYGPVKLSALSCTTRLWWRW